MMDSGERGRAFDALFAAHYRDVLEYVLRRASLASAEDVLGETFLIAWRRMDQLPDDPLPWLFGVARRVLANQRRGDHRQAALMGRLRAVSGGGIAVWAPPSSVGSDLADALRSLSSSEREALLLTPWEGLDASRGAKAAGCSSAAFRARLHRARKHVAAQLASSTWSASVTRASAEIP
jgi:RNA polymerase sigma-70 factor, ECF subfamily